MGLRARCHRAPREGFALLAVLGAMAVATSLTMLLLLIGREAVQASRNRIAQTRALWIARGCVAQARAMIDAKLAEEDPTQAWRALDGLIGRGQPDDCRMTLNPSGMHMDVNAVDGESLRNMAQAVDIRSETADSLAAALDDWRDGDDETRPQGAERAWYRESGQVEPRNGPLQSSEELLLVRGFTDVPQLDSLLAVGDGRVWLARAPAPVLAALPGLTPEAVSVLLALRSRSADMPIDLGMLLQSLSPDAHNVLASRFQHLASMVSAEPESWTLTSESRAGLPPVTETIELRLVRADRRAAIVNRREWP